MPEVSASGRAETCLASVFDEGSRLADGSRWSRARSRAEPLAAHRTAPLGSHLRITRLDTGATITIVVRDRGPYVRGRCVDLSVAASRPLAITGLARDQVRIGRRLTEPRVGAIAVISRRGGRLAGHTGIIWGFDKHHVMLISGNSIGRRVAEESVSRSRLIAIVDPSS